MAPHSSTLAWKIPWTERVTRSRTRLSDFTFTSHFHALEKEMATHSSVLAWRIPGTGEPGRLPSMGSHRVGHDWSDLAAAAAATLTWILLHLERMECCCAEDMKLFSMWWWDLISVSSSSNILEQMKTVVWFWPRLFHSLCQNFSLPV